MEKRFACSVTVSVSVTGFGEIRGSFIARPASVRPLLSPTNAPITSPMTSALVRSASTPSGAATIAGGGSNSPMGAGVAGSSPGVGVTAVSGASTSGLFSLGGASNTALSASEEATSTGCVISSLVAVFTSDTDASVTDVTASVSVDAAVRRYLCRRPSLRLSAGRRRCGSISLSEVESFCSLAVFASVEEATASTEPSPRRCPPRLPRRRLPRFGCSSPLSCVAGCSANCSAEASGLDASSSDGRRGPLRRRLLRSSRVLCSSAFLAPRALESLLRFLPLAAPSRCS